MADIPNITLALAGVCQAAALVQQFAVDGTTEQEPLRTTLQSLLVTKPESTLNVFGDELHHLRLGLATLLAQLGGRAGQLDNQLSRYWLGLLALGKQLDQSDEAKHELAQRLHQLERQLPLYENDICHEQMISNMAAIYSDVISPLGAKIRVFGRQDLLTRPDIQNRVRALLLCGIRAAFLWQQVGGSRWQLFFSRRKLFNQAKTFYQSLGVQE